MMGSVVPKYVIFITKIDGINAPETHRKFSLLSQQF
jgi:hypothetical protein